jgi:hypothetical protein
MAQKLRSDGTVALSARMPADLAARIQAEAHRRGVSASAVVRQLAADALQPTNQETPMTENTERDYVIAAAISDGKIFERRAEEYRRAWDADPEATRATLAKLEAMPEIAAKANGADRQMASAMSAFGIGRPAGGASAFPAASPAAAEQPAGDEQLQRAVGSFGAKVVGR